MNTPLSQKINSLFQGIVVPDCRYHDALKEELNDCYNLLIEKLKEEKKTGNERVYLSAYFDYNYSVNQSCALVLNLVDDRYIRKFLVKGNSNLTPLQQFVSQQQSIRLDIKSLKITNADTGGFSLVVVFHGGADEMHINIKNHKEAVELRDYISDLRIKR